MRILVLGSTGMLGHTMVKMLSHERGWEIVGTQARDAKVSGFFRVEDGVDALSTVGNDFDYVINCIMAAPWHIDPQASESVRRAIEVNALFPHVLARYTSSRKTRLIHISTDGVFSGKGGAYDENAPADTLDVYGRTKWLGEVHAPHVLTIRASLVGRSPLKKEGLLEWFLSQEDGSTVNGFTNHIWNGVTTLQFIELCRRIIREDHFDTLRNESSLFHFAPNTPVTKCQLLEMFKTTFKKNITIHPIDDPRGAVHRILTTQYKGLRSLFPHDIPMERAIADLEPYC
ncbi:sugar nucleotide-binding protein [Candidatus Uhrbacteria bacterium]|nr:sugar nucleotide-binding protein [Candidatus Uhrbacteria bacterium]